MRILLTSDTVGGVWTFTRELTTELLRRGHEIALVSFGRAPSEEQSAWCDLQSTRFGRSFQYVPSCVPLEWMQTNDVAFPQGRELLLRVADAFRPDILHSNQFCFGAIEVAIAKLITAHSDVLSWAEACRPNGLEDSSWLRRYQEIVTDGLHHSDAIAAPTQWMACALAQHYPGLPPVHVVLNGRTIRPEYSERTLQAISVGRIWDDAKNTAMLRDVNSPLPILVVGEQQHDGAVSPSHLGSAKLLGPLAETELIELFRRSSVYLATSIYEPFGLAPLEAALCGCAVLANDIPSLREVWGDSALYFRDAASLSVLLKRIKTDHAFLAHARQLSHAHALQFSADRMANGYESLYAELLAGRDAPLPKHSNHTLQELAVHAA